MAAQLIVILPSMRQGDWKLIRLPDRLPVLYKLSADTAKQNDILLQNLEKTRELLKKLGDWDVSLPHPVFLEGAEWKRNQLDLTQALRLSRRCEANNMAIFSGFM